MADNMTSGDMSANFTTTLGLTLGGAIEVNTVVGLLMGAAASTGGGGEGSSLALAPSSSASPSYYPSTSATTAAAAAASTHMATRGSPVYILDRLPPEAWVAMKVTHAVLTTAALVINVLSLGVIYGVVMRLTPPLQILTSLAFAELLAPWAVMTTYFPASACQEEIHTALLLMAHNACALSLLAYAIIHNIATFRPLQYERVVTPRRVWIAINVIWIGSVLTAHLHFLSTLTHHDPRRAYCAQVEANVGLALIMGAGVAASTILVTGCIYGRLFIHLRPIEAITGENGEPRKSTKGVVTGVLLLGAYIVGWGPYLATRLDAEQHYPGVGDGTRLALAVCQVFVLASCMAHPVIYSLRMTNVQMGYYRLYQRGRGYVVTSWSRVANRVRGDADDLPSTPLNPIESIC